MSKVAEGLCLEYYENVQEEEEIKRYWRRMLGMLKAYGAYTGRRKLYTNVCDPLTYHSVKHVLDKDFGGSEYRLRNRVHDLDEQFQFTINELNELAKYFKVETLKRREIERLVEDESTRRKMRDAINRHIEKGDKPFSLRLIPEKDFRKRKAK